MKKHVKARVLAFLKPLIRNEIVSILDDLDRAKEKSYRKKYQLPESFGFGRIRDIYFMGNNISIGEYSYFNSGIIQSGRSSKVQIGEWCAIGYNVNILAATHDPQKATGPRSERKIIEKDIVIGDRCWIGSNVFIREGVRIGDDVVVGANSVVTKDIPDQSIAAGVPAKVIRKK